MPADTLSLEGKVAIVTGSGRENGIGAGIALTLARNGAAVTIHYLSDSVADRARVVADKIKAVGGRVAIVQVALDTPEGAKRLVEETQKAFGTDRIDILVNNAGTGWAGATLEHTPEAIEKVINSNLKVPIFVAQATVPHMPPGGRVINVSSTASKLGMHDMPIYGATKAAVDSLTSSWAKEWGRSRGLTVNSIAPGPVMTDQISESFGENITKEQRWMTRAADRPGTIDDIADAALLLSSEKSRWITGQYIGVNGGVTN
ncbi:NAD(P)-binding protein [Hypoxylon sp. FL1284]|nr:NAD(P)-binding protein [Hypoxylon sp. FL1284]